MQWTKKLGTARSILIFLGVTLASYVLILVIENSLAGLSLPTILDRQYGFAYGDAYRQIDSYSKEARILYTYLQAVDMAFLAGYGIFFAGLIVFLSGKLFPSRPKLFRFALIGLVAAGCDCLENIGLFIMIRIHPAPYPVLAVLTSGIGVAKVGLFYICALLCVIGLAAWGVKGIKK